MKKSPARRKGDSQSNTRRSVASDSDKIRMIHHNLESIKTEISKGTDVDSDVVRRLESGLAQYEKRFRPRR